MSVSALTSLTCQNCTKHPIVSGRITVKVFLAWALDEAMSIWLKHSLVSSRCEWIQNWSGLRSGPTPEYDYLKLYITLPLAVQCRAFRIWVGQNASSASEAFLNMSLRLNHIASIFPICTHPSALTSQSKPVTTLKWSFLVGKFSLCKIICITMNPFLSHDTSINSQTACLFFLSVWFFNDEKPSK